MLLVSNDFPPAVGGIAQTLGDICASLPPDRVCVLAQDMPGAAAHDAAQPYRVHRLPYRAGARLGRAADLLAFARRARALARSEHCGLVFFDKAFPLPLIALLPGYLGRPYVLQAYGADLLLPRGAAAQALQGKILRKAARVIAISRFTRDLLIEQGVAPNRIALIHPKAKFDRYQAPVDVDAFRAAHGLAGRRVLLTVGRLVPRKGVDRVIEAMPRIRAEIPEALYVVVGNGPELPRLRKLAEDTGVAEQVQFVTDCGDDQLPAYYHACDLFIMPSRYIREQGDVEGFGIVFLEANACRKPAIGGRSGGQPDAIAEGESGLLCDPEDPADIAETALRVLRDPALAARLGEAGYDRVMANFQAHHYGPEFIEHILEAPSL